MRIEQLLVVTVYPPYVDEAPAMRKESLDAPEPCLAMNHGATPRILLVDDDRKLARMLVELLLANGLNATAVHDGQAGIERAREEQWDLIVLDVMLPSIDGFKLLKRLRTTSQVPILMLTARGGEADRVAGLEDGADDYLPKTVSARELLARIKALLRRAAARRYEADQERTTLQVGELLIDVSGRKAALAATALSLTPVEFDLLCALARRRGTVCSRDELMEQVRGRELDAFDRAIDVHIAALRRKLGDDPRAPRFIRTVRTAGYVLDDPGAPAS